MASASTGEAIAVYQAPRAARMLAADGWQVRAIEQITDLMGMQEGEGPRLIVTGVARASAAKAADLVTRLRSVAPLVDVIVTRNQAPGALVRAVLRAGATDVVLSDDREALAGAVRDVLERQRLLPQVEELSRARSRSGRFEGLLSRNQTMWEGFITIARTAQSDATVLIMGETGTGKDLLARAIHRRSRREGRFVAVNCSSIRPEIVESELFGHERGSFTGAHQAKQGLFRHADGGTLLLDEIGDMPAAAQLSLLRVLQEGTIRPVGAARELPVNVRVIAATNAPLRDQVKHGTFREDLFYRLDVIRLEVPPLRERPEDILYLFGHFLRGLCRRYGVQRPQLHQRFIDALTDYPWPGNVRQLENVVERLVLEGPRERLSARDLRRLLPSSSEQGASSNRSPVVQDELSSQGVALDPSRPLSENLDPAIAALERRYLEAVLAAHNGRVIQTAEHAGLSRRTLLRKMQQYGIDKRRFRERVEGG